MDFRGASAESLADLTLALAKVKKSELAKVAGELFTVSTLVRSQPALRRTVTDPSVATQAKQALVAGIFTDQVSKTTLGLLSTAAGRKWTASVDLPNALERLSEIAHIASAKDAGVIADQLFAFGQAVTHDNELRDALADPARTLPDRAELVKGLLADKADSATVALAQQAVLGSYRTVTTALAAYQEVIAETNKQGVATVRVARPLTAEHTQRLAEALSRRAGHPVHLNVVVEPDLVGGISVAVGDDVIDGTISTRLAQASRQLAG